MSLLRTLLEPDHDENPERAEAARAANLIQVGEFQLIQLAYAEWFGEDMPEAMGNTLFRAYMLQDQVPHWVRHYARHILALDAAGRLDDREPAYHRFDPAYMLQDQVPHWVRHYARHILALDAAGRLDDREPAYHRFDPAYTRPVSDGVRRFSIAATAVVICLLGGLWIAHGLSGEGTSVLPPYFSEKELRTRG